MRTHERLAVVAVALILAATGCGSTYPATLPPSLGHSPPSATFRYAEPANRVIKAFTAGAMQWRFGNRVATVRSREAGRVVIDVRLGTLSGNYLGAFVVDVVPSEGGTRVDVRTVNAGGASDIGESEIELLKQAADAHLVS